MNSNVDFYFNKPTPWQEEIKHLRTIVLGCGLSEELKWGCPCYVLEGRNIVLIHVFKEYCALLFFKGALLKDTDGILIQQTKNVQVPRQIRFTNVREITGMKSVLKSYIKQAIDVEKSGVNVKLKKTVEFAMPEEFKNALKENRALNTAFHRLTPGRQRAYLLFFSAAKQSKTRMARIEKYAPEILKGRGMND